MRRASPQQTEAQFQAAVVQLARLQGFMVYHTYDSRRSEPGFPDLVLVGHGRILYVELKLDSGRLSHAQEAWRDAILGNGGWWRVWRPMDWPEIESELAS